MRACIYVKTIFYFDIGVTMNNLLKASFLTMLVSISSYTFADNVDFSALVEKVSPAVVSINVVKQEPMLNPRGIPESFKSLFGQELRMPQPSQESSNYGSGFFITKDGYLLTNHHVVDKASKVSIILNDRREIDAKVIGTDKRTDIALLKVEGSYPTLDIVPQTPVKVGEPVLAIGSPFGFDYSASSGIVSAKSRNMSSEISVPFIQSDVALNPGNSGGPLFNKNGQVIGVNSRIFSGTGGYMGLSFSVPIDVAMDIASQLKQYGKVSRAYLGVSFQEINRDLAETYGFSKPKGVLINKIYANSPASLAGLRVGDVILNYRDKEINQITDLLELLHREKPSEIVPIQVLRQGKIEKYQVQIQAVPEVESVKNQVVLNDENQVVGMIFRDLSKAEQNELSLNGILITDLASDGLAAKAGLAVGDVITHVNDIAINQVDDFIGNVVKLGQSRDIVRISIWRQGEVAILPLRLK